MSHVLLCGHHRDSDTIYSLQSNADGFLQIHSKDQQVADKLDTLITAVGTTSGTVTVNNFPETYATSTDIANFSSKFNNEMDAIKVFSTNNITSVDVNNIVEVGSSTLASETTLTTANGKLDTIAEGNAIIGTQITQLNDKIILDGDYLQVNVKNFATEIAVSNFPSNVASRIEGLYGTGYLPITCDNTGNLNVNVVSGGSGGGSGGGLVQIQDYSGADIGSTVVNTVRGLNMYILGNENQGSFANILNGSLASSAISTPLAINNMYLNNSVLTYEDTNTTITSALNILVSNNGTDYVVLATIQPATSLSTKRTTSTVLRLKPFTHIAIQNLNTTTTLLNVKCSLFSS